MDEVYIRLPYPPLSGNHQYHHNSDGSKTLKQEVLAYRALVKRTLYAVGEDDQFYGADGTLLWVEWNIHPPAGTRDVDNFRKVLADALSKAGLWTDDSGNVLRLEVFRWMDPARDAKTAWVDLWLRELPADEAAIEALTGESEEAPTSLASDPVPAAKTGPRARARARKVSGVPEAEIAAPAVDWVPARGGL